MVGACLAVGVGGSGGGCPGVVGETDRSLAALLATGALESRPVARAGNMDSRGKAHLFRELGHLEWFSRIADSGVDCAVTGAGDTSERWINGGMLGGLMRNSSDGRLTKRRGLI